MGFNHLVTVIVYQLVTSAALALADGVTQAKA
jgi:hypothetical protein